MFMLKQKVFLPKSLGYFGVENAFTWLKTQLKLFSLSEFCPIVYCPGAAILQVGTKRGTERSHSGKFWNNFLLFAKKSSGHMHKYRAVQSWGAGIMQLIDVWTVGWVTPIAFSLVNKCNCETKKM